MEYGRRFRPSALRVNFNVGIPSLQAVLGGHLVTYHQFGYLLALPLLGSCVPFGVGGLSAFPGRLGISPLFTSSVISAEVGWFNAPEFDYTLHVMSVSSTTVL